MLDGTERRALLVEDEAIIALNENMTLEKNGLDVYIVHCGPAALERVRSASDIDLVLMDISAGEFVLLEAIQTASELFDAHKKLQNSEREYRTMVETAPMPFQSLNADGCLIDVNTAWLEAMGYRRQEILGTWFGDLLSPDQVVPDTPEGNSI